MAKQPIYEGLTRNPVGRSVQDGMTIKGMSKPASSQPKPQGRPVGVLQSAPGAILRFQLSKSPLTRQSA